MFKEIYGNLRVKPHYVGFFGVNDSQNFNLENPQIMHCISCYKFPINASNLRTQARKGLISHYNTNGIASLKKRVNANHVVFGLRRKQKQFNEKECEKTISKKEAKYV
jgi:hypothetical protein